MPRDELMLSFQEVDHVVDVVEAGEDQDVVLVIIMMAREVEVEEEDEFPSWTALFNFPYNFDVLLVEILLTAFGIDDFNRGKKTKKR